MNRFFKSGSFYFAEDISRAGNNRDCGNSGNKFSAGNGSAGSGVDFIFAFFGFVFVIIGSVEERKSDFGFAAGAFTELLC